MLWMLLLMFTVHHTYYFRLISVNLSVSVHNFTLWSTWLILFGGFFNLPVIFHKLITQSRLNLSMKTVWQYYNIIKQFGFKDKQTNVCNDLVFQTAGVTVWLGKIQQQVCPSKTQPTKMAVPRRSCPAWL